MLARTVSVFVPAFNEAGNLDAAVRDIVTAAEAVLDDYELMIVNDGSTDGTGEIADALALEFPRVRTLHQPKNLGLKAGFRRALDEAKLDYFGFLPGDHEVAVDSVTRILRAVGTADLVVPYHGNSAARQGHRRLLTWGSTTVMNAAFGMRLRYYQGPCVYPTAVVRRIPSGAGGFFFLAEILIRALRSGCGYVEVPLTHQERAHGSSKAVSLGNMRAALVMIGRLWWHLRVRGAEPIPKEGES